MKLLVAVGKNQYTWKFQSLYSPTFICSRCLNMVLGNNLSLERPVKTGERDIFRIYRRSNSEAPRENAFLKNLPETLLKTYLRPDSFFQNAKFIKFQSCCFLLAAESFIDIRKSSFISKPNSLDMVAFLIRSCDV